jgi:hypothetical protein
MAQDRPLVLVHPPAAAEWPCTCLTRPGSHNSTLPSTALQLACQLISMIACARQLAVEGLTRELRVFAKLKVSRWEKSGPKAVLRLTRCCALPPRCWPMCCHPKWNRTVVACDMVLVMTLVLQNYAAACLLWHPPRAAH